MPGPDLDAMTADERRAWIARSVEAECAAQGVPAVIDDPVRLARIARLVRPTVAEHWTRSAA
jgi:thiamine monophosphate synthase